MEKESERDIRNFAFSKRTKLATAVGMKSWVRFCKEFGLKTLLDFRQPEYRLSETQKLTNFLQFEMNRVSKRTGRKKMNSYTSFMCYYEDIKRYHTANCLEWKPTYLIHLKLKSIRRQYSKGKNRKLPLLSSMVNRMERCKSLDPELDKDDELVVMIMLLSIYGLFRISELLSQPSYTLELVNEKKQITVRLTDTKTLQRNDGLPELVVVTELGVRKDLRWCPIDLLLRRHFRIKKGKRKQIISVLMTNGKRLTRTEYSRRLKGALAKIGINPQKYDTHSGRIGGATMLWDAGFSDAQIMKFGRWRSDSWSIYCRALKSKFIELSRRLKESELSENDVVMDTEDMVISL